MSIRSDPSILRQGLSVCLSQKFDIRYMKCQIILILIKSYLSPLSKIIIEQRITLYPIRGDRGTSVSTFSQLFNTPMLTPVSSNITNSRCKCNNRVIQSTSQIHNVSVMTTFDPKSVTRVVCARALDVRPWTISITRSRRK